jgi:GNAT superfamily N-acetyltransferase
MNRVELRDGRTLEVEERTYPIPSAKRTELVDLLQQEWPRTDVDWLQSMRGVYAADLVTRALLAACDGRAVATASLAYPKDQPEVCVIEDVMTVPEFRGYGIARILTARLVDLGFAAGCKVAYLGNVPTPRPVYEKVGFVRLSGVFMRRPAPGHESYESEAFAAGQPLEIREANWGDLPSFACFMAQPMEDCLAHYGQGLTSTRYAPARRCVSAFTSVKYETEGRGGVMLVLAGTRFRHRLMGFAGAVPGAGPLLADTARLDVAVHDHAREHGPALLAKLLEWCAARKMAAAEALIVATDAKLRWFEDAGFGRAAVIPGAIRLATGPCDLIMVRKMLG